MQLHRICSQSTDEARHAMSREKMNFLDSGIRGQESGVRAAQQANDEDTVICYPVVNRMRFKM